MVLVLPLMLVLWLLPSKLSPLARDLYLYMDFDLLLKLSKSKNKLGKQLAH